MATRTDEGVLASWTWFFDTEEEAHLFGLGQKDELANEDGFSYVEHFVEEVTGLRLVESDDVEYDLKAGSWKLTLRFVDSRPSDPDDDAPEAA